jgi:hypothetical protein
MCLDRYFKDYCEWHESSDTCYQFLSLTTHKSIGLVAGGQCLFYLDQACTMSSDIVWVDGRPAA